MSEQLPNISHESEDYDPDKNLSQEGSLSPEEEQAQLRAKEVLNEQLQYWLKQKGAGKEGAGLEVAKLEALIIAAQEANFTKPVNFRGVNKKGEEVERTTSINRYLALRLEYLNRNVVQTITQIEGLASDDPKRSKLQKELDFTYSLYDKAEAAAQAIDVYSEAAEDGSTGEDTEGKAQKKEDFQRGQPVKLHLRDSLVDGKVITTKHKQFRGKEQDVVVVEVEENRSKVRYEVPIQFLKHFNDSEATGKNENNNEPPEPPEGVENHDQYEPEDSWLDPRRIKELREEFQRKYIIAKEEEKARRRRLQDDTPVKFTPSFIDKLKTDVIENAISLARENAQKVQGRFGIGKISKEPSKETKQHIAAMIDNENLDEQAAEADYHRFRIGQNVKYAHLGGKVEAGWRVKSFIDNNAAGIVTVKLEKDGQPDRFISQEELLRMQTLELGATNEVGLITDYFGKSLGELMGKPVKIKSPSNGEIVDGGQFRGVSLQGGVYLADPEGNPLPQKVPVQEFIEWQKEDSAPESGSDPSEEPEDAEASPPDSEAADGGKEDAKEEGNETEDTDEDGDTPAEDGEPTEPRARDEDATDDASSPKSKEQLKVESMREKLEALKAKKVSKSVFEVTWTRWKDFWKKFDRGETNKERKKNKRKKRIVIGVGSVAAVGTVAPVAWGVALSPLVIAEHRAHKVSRWNLQRRINQLEEKIKDEEEEIAIRETKAS